jgi:hypothetical protein
LWLAGAGIADREGAHEGRPYGERNYYRHHYWLGLAHNGIIRLKRKICIVDIFSGVKDARYGSWRISLGSAHRGAQGLVELRGY